MKAVFKLMVFSIMLNFAVGIMLTAFPIFETRGDTGGLEYSETYGEPFTTTMEDEIRPSGELEDAGDSIYRVLDTLSLGFISKFLTAVDTYMFGFINFLDKILGSALDNMRDPIRVILKGVMTIAYIYGAFVLWTGKEELQE